MKTVKGASYREGRLENKELFESMEALRFIDCFFSGSLGARISNARDRWTVRNVELIRCKAGAVTVGPVIFEDVLVDGLSTTEHLWLPGCAFRHCVLRGAIGSIVNYQEGHVLDSPTSSVNRAFMAANDEFYADVDWALDISDATFEDLDIRAVPAHLIRIRRPAQIRVRYAAALDALERGLLNEATKYARAFVEASLSHRSDGKTDFILVAGRGRRSAELMHLFRLLEDSGATS